MDALLPHHAPEGVKGGGQRALGAYVGPGLLIAIDIIGIDVFNGFLLAGQRSQGYAGVVI